jgi:hypothetical protein
VTEQPPSSPRDQSIADEHAADATLRAIGRRHGVSAERVRQIVNAQRARAVTGGWTIYTNGPYQCPDCDHPPYRPPSLLRRHLQDEHRYSWERAHDLLIAMIGEPPPG